MYNKRQFKKLNDKKVLHKVGKHWVTISIALLGLLGGGAVATHVSANADTTSNNDQNQSNHQTNINQLQNNKTTLQTNDQSNHSFQYIQNNNIYQQANRLHNEVIRNANLNNKDVNNSSNQSKGNINSNINYFKSKDIATNYEHKNNNKYTLSDKLTLTQGNNLLSSTQFPHIITTGKWDNTNINYYSNDVMELTGNGTINASDVPDLPFNRNNDDWNLKIDENNAHIIMNNSKNGGEFSAEHHPVYNNFRYMDLSGLDSSKITNMNFMFQGDTLQSLNLTNLNTNSAISKNNMFDMFANSFSDPITPANIYDVPNTSRVSSDFVDDLSKLVLSSGVNLSKEFNPIPYYRGNEYNGLQNSNFFDYEDIINQYGKDSTHKIENGTQPSGIYYAATKADIHLINQNGNVTDTHKIIQIPIHPDSDYRGLSTLDEIKDSGINFNGMSIDKTGQDLNAYEKADSYTPYINVKVTDTSVYPTKNVNYINFINDDPNQNKSFLGSYNVSNGKLNNSNIKNILPKGYYLNPSDQNNTININDKGKHYINLHLLNDNVWTGYRWGKAKVLFDGLNHTVYVYGGGVVGNDAKPFSDFSDANYQSIFNDLKKISKGSPTDYVYDYFPTSNDLYGHYNYHYGHYAYHSYDDGDYSYEGIISRLSNKPSLPHPIAFKPDITPNNNNNSNNNNNNNNNYGNNRKFVNWNLNIIDAHAPQNSTGLFNGYGVGDIFNTLNLNGLDTNSVNNMSCMFLYLPFKHVNMSSLNSHNVTNMSSMFAADDRVPDLSHLDTRNVINMSNMFSRDNQIPNLSNFDTRNVTNMTYMFASDGPNISSLDLSNFNTANVTNMSHMFSSDSNLKSLNISGFTTQRIPKYSQNQSNSDYGMSHMFDNDYNINDNLNKIVLGNKTNLNKANQNSFPSNIYISSDGNYANKELTDGTQSAGSYYHAIPVNIHFIYSNGNIKDTNDNILVPLNPDNGYHGNIDNNLSNIPNDYQELPRTQQNFQIYNLNNNNHNIKPFVNVRISKNNKPQNLTRNVQIPVYMNNRSNGYKTVSITGTIGEVVNLTNNMANNKNGYNKSVTGFVDINENSDEVHGRFNYTRIQNDLDNIETGIYHGLDYKYTPNNKLLEFTKGSLVWNDSKEFLLSDNAPTALINATSIKFDSDIDTSHVTNMDNMFASDGSLQRLDLGHFNTSNVTSMNSVFGSDEALKDLNIGNFDTSKVKANYSDPSDFMFDNPNLQELTLGSKTNLSVPKAYRKQVDLITPFFQNNVNANGNNTTQEIMDGTQPAGTYYIKSNSSMYHDKISSDLKEASVNIQDLSNIPNNAPTSNDATPNEINSALDSDANATSIISNDVSMARNANMVLNNDNQIISPNSATVSNATSESNNINNYMDNIEDTVNSADNLYRTKHSIHPSSLAQKYHLQINLDLNMASAYIRDMNTSNILDYLNVSYDSSISSSNALMALNYDSYAKSIINNNINMAKNADITINNDYNMVNPTSLTLSNANSETDNIKSYTNNVDNAMTSAMNQYQHIQSANNKDELKQLNNDKSLINNYNSQFNDDASNTNVISNAKATSSMNEDKSIIVYTISNINNDIRNPNSNTLNNASQQVSIATSALNNANYIKSSAISLSNDKNFSSNNNIVKNENNINIDKITLNNDTNQIKQYIENSNILSNPLALSMINRDSSVAASADQAIANDQLNPTATNTSNANEELSVATSADKEAQQVALSAINSAASASAANRSNSNHNTTPDNVNSNGGSNDINPQNPASPSNNLPSNGNSTSNTNHNDVTPSPDNDHQSTPSDTPSDDSNNNDSDNGDNSDVNSGNNSNRNNTENDNTNADNGNGNNESNNLPNANSDNAVNGTQQQTNGNNNGSLPQTGESSSHNKAIAAALLAVSASIGALDDVINRKRRYN